jgi:hypothetical protein
MPATTRSARLLSLRAIERHAGKFRYDQGRYAHARDHVARALELRRGGDPDLVASSQIALDAASRRAAR